MELNWNNANSFLNQLLEEKYDDWNQRDMLAYATTNFRINMSKLSISERESEIDGALAVVIHKRAEIENSELNRKQDRLNLLEIFEHEISSHLPAEKASKLIVWNGANNQLADLFRQLKELIDPRTKKPFISNSYEEIAQFLIQNFECYKDTKVSTVLTTLKKRGQKIKQPLIVGLSNQNEE